MTSLAASAWVEIPADCPISGKIDTDGLHFAIGSTAAGDLAFDVVFEPGALRRFVDLANGMLAECELAAEDGDGTP